MNRPPDDGAGFGAAGADGAGAGAAGAGVDGFGADCFVEPEGFADCAAFSCAAC